MKEVSRIHLAKVVFDIEADAKKHLSKYNQEVQATLPETEADEIMQDIELRMVEILENRGVKAGGVIGEEDVKAIIDQLGTPEQFNEESEGQKAEREDSRITKRLYRDPDHGVIAGVASGLGAYLGLDPVLIRIGFLALFFANGFGLLLYIILWALVPEAKTKAQKLDMAGKAVNLESLQENIKNAANSGAKNIKRNYKKPALTLLTLISRIMAIGFAFGSLGIMLAATLGTAAFLQVNSFLSLTENTAGMVLIGAGWLGILSISLFLLTASVAFWRLSAKSVAGVAFAAVITGIIALFIGVAALPYGFSSLHLKYREACAKNSLNCPNLEIVKPGDYRINVTSQFN